MRVLIMLPTGDTVDRNDFDGSRLEVVQAEVGGKFKAVPLTGDCCVLVNEDQTQALGFNERASRLTGQSLRGTAVLVGICDGTDGPHGDTELCNVPPDMMLAAMACIPT